MLSASHTASRFCRQKTKHGPLSDKLTLELRERGEDVKDETAKVIGPGIPVPHEMLVFGQNLT